MRVIVLGSGVVGTSTAYYLAEAGHEVLVIDRQPGPALETSFANAGEVSPGYASPWAAPGVPIKALRWLFMRHRPLFIWPTLNAAKIALWPDDAAQLHERALSDKQEQDGADFRVQPRSSARSPRQRRGSRTMSVAKGHCSCSAAENARGNFQGHRNLAKIGSAIRTPRP